MSSNRTGALALVESPAQLLNVIELAYADPGLFRVPIVVLAPGGGPGRDQLGRMADLAREAGHEVCWSDPRRGGVLAARCALDLLTRLGGVRRLVVGDPFSGVLQMLIALVRPTEVTVVDDGTATLEFARQWAHGDRLTRWHTSEHPHGVSDRARDRLALLTQHRLGPKTCRLRLFTSMLTEADGSGLHGVEILRNSYTWLRVRCPFPEVTDGADLVGTSLVESGVVRADAYLEGVRHLVEQLGVRRYLAHRRESDAKLAQIAALGVEVVRPPLPLELMARYGPVARTIVSFPSTVVHTLPLVLAGTGVQTVICPVPSDWYTDRAPQRAGAFLGTVTDSARARHGLLAVAC